MGRAGIGAGGTCCWGALPSPSPTAASLACRRFRGHAVLERVLPKPGRDAAPRPRVEVQCLQAALGLAAGEGGMLPPPHPQRCRGRGSLAALKQSLGCFLASAAMATPDSNRLVRQGASEVGALQRSAHNLGRAGLSQALVGPATPVPLLTGATGCHSPPPSPLPESLASPLQRASLRQTAGLWYSETLRRLLCGQGCVWLGGRWGGWQCWAGSPHPGCVILGWDCRLSCWGCDGDCGHRDGKKAALCPGLVHMDAPAL